MKVCSWFTTEYVLAALCILNSFCSIQCGEHWVFNLYLIAALSPSLISYDGHLDVLVEKIPSNLGLWPIHMEIVHVCVSGIFTSCKQDSAVPSLGTEWKGEGNH